MRIVLIGFMGSGKSSVAKILGQKLEMPVLELDQILLDRSGFNSIAQVIDQFGEDYFRNLESQTLIQALNQDDVIISTGGGIITRASNINNLRFRNSKIIFLKTSFTAILERLVNDQERPLFRDKIKARELFEQRQQLYLAAADLQIDTSNLTIEEVSQLILEKLNYHDKC